MTPAALRDGEVQYYASPVLVKKTQYYATLTNQRLLIEGPKTHEFSVTSLQGAYPELLEGLDHGLKLIISTPKGQRDMIWAFPVEDKFKQGETDSWIAAVNKAMGDKPFASGTFSGIETETPLGEAHREGIRFNNTIEIGAAAVGASGAGAGAGTAGAPAPSSSSAVPAASSPAAAASVISSSPETNPSADTAAPAVDLIRGETIAVSTAGVRVKRTFYTAYLTNLRLILQNNLGKIGREFAIAEIKDAAEMESDAGEPEIAVSIGTQAGLKQMLIIYPTEASRSAWMIELRNKLPRRAPPAPQDAAVSKSRIGTFTPATNERTLITTPGVHIKNRLVVLHLTNTRFVIDSVNGVIGEFAVSTLSRAVRMASELGEPGISLTIASPAGEREMHLIFPSMNDREAWMDSLQQFIPDEAPGYGAAGYGAGYGAAGYTSSSGGQQYTVTQVKPRAPANTQMIECPNCGAQNPASEAFCALCGSALHGGYRVPAGSGSTGDARGREKYKPEKYKPPKEPKQKAPRPEYTGGVIGFISRPRDAFEYYAHESPKAAFPLFLVFGAIWAVLTAVCLTYLLPAVVNIDPAEFPIFAALQEDVLLMVIFVLILWIIWVIALLVHALITGLIARIFSPTARIPEVMAITMRSSLTFAFVGWIPIIGMFAASIWTAIESWFGLRMTQDTSPAGAAIASFVGMIAVYLILFIIGGGFA